jgi:hypothetical protein
MTIAVSAGLRRTVTSYLKNTVRAYTFSQGKNTADARVGSVSSITVKPGREQANWFALQHNHTSAASPYLSLIVSKGNASDSACECRYLKTQIGTAMSAQLF